MNTKKLILPAAIAAVGIISFAGLSTVSADNEETGKFGQMGQRFAQRFGLDQTEVESFLQEDRQAMRQERKEEMQAKSDEKLSEAVDNGIITEDQKAALIAKREENKPDMGENRDLSVEEREALRETNKADMESWANDNGIDLEALHEYLGGPQGPREGKSGRGMGSRQAE